ncbi:MAG: DUF1738 domain-containing protein [Bacteroidia bacterium]|nr:DUF1738 domain-containing protein [Bacteroidia bacterium]
MKNKKSKNLYDEVTEIIIELLSSHLGSWNKPWVQIGADGERAHNALSLRPYSGINQFLLSFKAVKEAFPTNAWMTFAQVRGEGGTIKKGQKASMVVYWKMMYFDRDGKRLDNWEVEALTRDERASAGINSKGMLRYFNVFNVAQTEGMAQKFYQVKEIASLSEFEKDARAEALLDGSGASIRYEAGNRAFYNSSQDVITLPLREQFKGTEALYETALHELGHWTGHFTRLNRPLGNEFGSPEYALEELVAELCAAFLCAELGFSKAITNNAAYIQSWISALQNDTKYIFKASKLAQDAVGFVGDRCLTNKV